MCLASNTIMVMVALKRFTNFYGHSRGVIPTWTKYWVHKSGEHPFKKHLLTSLLGKFVDFFVDFIPQKRSSHCWNHTLEIPKNAISTLTCKNPNNTPNFIEYNATTKAEISEKMAWNSSEIETKPECKMNGEIFKENRSNNYKNICFLFLCIYVIYIIIITITSLDLSFFTLTKPKTRIFKSIKYAVVVICRCCSAVQVIFSPLEDFHPKIISIQ